MATIAARLEAFRSVLLANNYNQSPELDGFYSGIEIHRQFFLSGPELSDERGYSSSTADSIWIIEASIAFEPSPDSQDVDATRFDIATWIEELVSAWTNDTTLTSDVVRFTSSAPELVDGKFWIVDVRAELEHIRNL